MKLFKFLEILNQEKFPFKLEYIDWNRNIKVTVDTFSEVIEICFDENGINTMTKFMEVESTEDINRIYEEIEGLKDRPLKSWIEASEDLGIKFIYPYTFKGLNGEEYEVTGLLPEFGTGKGMIISDRRTDEEACYMADILNEYGSTGLNPLYYDKYDRDLFIETLSDWGWIGDESQKPNWLKNNDELKYN